MKNGRQSLKSLADRFFLPTPALPKGEERFVWLM